MLSFPVLPWYFHILPWIIPQFPTPKKPIWSPRSSPQPRLFGGLGASSEGPGWCSGGHSAMRWFSVSPAFPTCFFGQNWWFFPCVEAMILIFYKRISEINKGLWWFIRKVPSFQVGIDSRQRWGWLIANEHGDFTTKYLRFEWVWLLFTSPNRKNPPIPNHGSSNYWI